MQVSGFSIPFILSELPWVFGDTETQMETLQESRYDPGRSVTVMMGRHAEPFGLCVYFSGSLNALSSIMDSIFDVLGVAH